MNSSTILQAAARMLADDPDLLRDVERELRNRYVQDYRVCCLGSPREALDALERIIEEKGGRS